MKRVFFKFILIVIAIVTLCLACCISVNAEASVWDGEITQPTSIRVIDGKVWYEINSARELAYISVIGEEWNTNNYILNTDIILNDVEIKYDAEGSITTNTSLIKKWKPIGHYTGIFDGNDHTISGLYVDSSGDAGMFSSGTCTIKNLNIKNAFVKGSAYTGGIIGRAEYVSYIEGCSFYGCVHGSGICGAADLSYIKDCINNGDVWGCGGIVGQCSPFGISNCINYAYVHGEKYTKVGGIAGSFDSTHPIKKCKNYGNVEGKDVVGGILGYVTRGPYLVDCKNYGNVTGNDYVGGVLGQNDNDNDRSYVFRGLINCANVIGNSNVGGLVGSISNTTISSSYSIGKVSGDNAAGALFGYIELGSCTVEKPIYYLKTDSVNSELYGAGNYNDIDGMIQGDCEDCFPICLNKDADDSYDKLNPLRKITFNLNGGIGEISPIKVRNNKAIGTLPIPEKSENEFDGWKQSGYSSFITENTIVRSDMTLEAQWTDVHVHSIKKFSKIEPTCTETGNIEYYVCQKCGQYYEDEAGVKGIGKSAIVIPALGHKIVLVIQKDPTCIEYGNIKHWKCENCDEYYSDSNGENVIEDKNEVLIELTGHKWELESTVDTKPTCTEKGSRSIHCKYCDAIKEGSAEAVEATGHSYGSWETTLEPTCTEKGSKHRKCSKCDHEDVAEIAATGHDYTSYTIEPTCSQKGYTIHICARCKDSYIDSEAQATDHQFGDWQTIRDSSCSDNGFQQRVCSICGLVQSKDLDKKEHEWNGDFTIDSDASCTVDGSKSIHCRNCEAVKNSTVIKAQGHQFSAWEQTAKPTCVDKGCFERECSFCHEIEKMWTMANGHSYQHVENKAEVCVAGRTYDQCSVCGDIINENVIPALNAPITTISKLKPYKKAFTVYWSKKTGITGYKIRYSLNSSMASAKTVTVKGSTVSSKKITKLKAKKKYYVQVQTYRTVEGKTYTSSWSTKKSVKTK